jgi:hypothetical protein
MRILSSIYEMRRHYDEVPGVTKEAWDLYCLLVENKS